jgi:hypothetical protein
MIALLAGLLTLPAAVHAFYNPEAGRWLNRDPIEERGGKNLYRLLDNDSLSRVDVLGLDDFLWIEPNEVQPPHAVPDRGGWTDWEEFAPEALAYSPDGCCFGVRLSGGRARAVVVYGPGEFLGHNVLEHERFHVTQHLRPAYDQFKATASGLGRPCMSKARAVCLSTVIVRELRDEYVALSFRDGVEYDLALYGHIAEPILQEQVRVRVARLTAAYAAAQAATATSIAACPVE